MSFGLGVMMKILQVGLSEFFMNFSTTLSEFEMKTGIDWYRIGLRCKHESCRYKC
ncbi:hypothetical protein MTR_3g448920 [Medicago truncatula]|uniref:Uncharacterized protein n=1 Tax=Medicago truncatula TaxID=3880 RepID=A0A072UVF0_MEDTR|nr:hypothetical protein MTR_3g448920 [Medicago truncatula]